MNEHTVEINMASASVERAIARARRDRADFIHGMIAELGRKIGRTLARIGRRPTGRQATA